jgi:alkaline phosphatase
MIKRAFQGTFEAPFDNREGVGAVMAGVLANYNGIYFIGTNHTADYVEISAWGPGSDRIPTFVRNTALFDLMVEMADVTAYAEG